MDMEANRLSPRPGSPAGCWAEVCEALEPGPSLPWPAPAHVKKEILAFDNLGAAWMGCLLWSGRCGGRVQGAQVVLQTCLQLSQTLQPGSHVLLAGAHQACYRVAVVVANAVHAHGLPAFWEHVTWGARPSVSAEAQQCGGGRALLLGF
eukprot:1025336-Pelagomonas_calceolata.AAC.6